MVESQTMRKLNLSAQVDETVDLFIALIKLITISLTHHITNKVMVRYPNISTVKLRLGDSLILSSDIIHQIVMIW